MSTSEARVRTFLRATVGGTPDEEIADALGRSVQAAAAKHLRAHHESVIAAQTATGRRPHDPSPDAERAELRALRQWFRTSAAALGMQTGPKGEDE